MCSTNIHSIKLWSNPRTINQIDEQKKINKNNLKLQMINSAGNHVFEITSSGKEEIKPMKKKKN